MVMIRLSAVLLETGHAHLWYICCLFAELNNDSFSVVFWRNWRTKIQYFRWKRWDITVSISVHWTASNHLTSWLQLFVLQWVPVKASSRHLGEWAATVKLSHYQFTLRQPTQFSDFTNLPNDSVLRGLYNGVSADKQYSGSVSKIWNIYSVDNALLGFLWDETPAMSSVPSVGICGRRN